MLLRSGNGDGAARSADWVCTAALQLTETAILITAVTKKKEAAIFVPSESCSTLLHIKLCIEENLALYSEKILCINI